MGIDLKIFQLCAEKGTFWVRLFGYGVTGKDTRTHGLLFSERNGYTKTLRLGFWSFSALRPMNFRTARTK